RRLRAEDRLAVRGRLEPGSAGGTQHSEDRSEPRPLAAARAARAASGTVQKDQPVKDADRGLLGWTLSFLRPHRHRAALLVGLLASEVALGALQPWPFKIVIDY